MREKIFYTIIFFSLCLKCFSFENDSLSEKEKHFIIKTNPTLWASHETEFDILGEYRTKYIGIEGGAGYNLVMFSGQGYTIRSGIKFYFNRKERRGKRISQIYLEPLFFYRYIHFGEADYGYGGYNPDPHPIGIDDLELFSRNRNPVFKAIEIKNVLASELLFGKNIIISKHSLFNWYCGIGCRRIMRTLDETYSYRSHLPLSEQYIMDNATWFTIHLGFGFEYIF